MKKELIALEPIGIVIKEELFDPYQVTAYRVCKDIGIPAMTLNNILHGKRPLSSEVALKLGKYFKIDPKYLLNLQTELEVRQKERELHKELIAIHPLDTTAA